MPTSPVKKRLARVGDLVPVEDHTVRRRALRRTLILEAALALIDEQGIDACTMQGLAARLGVTPRALYRHVASKDELLRGVVQFALADMTIPDPAWPWRDRLRHSGFEIIRVLRAHPHAAALCAGPRSAVFPAVIPVVDGIIGAFRDAGLGDEAAIRFAHVLANYSLGFALVDADVRLRPDAGAVIEPLGDAAASRMPRIAQSREFLLSFVNEGRQATDEQFAFGLDLLLDGLDTALVARQAPTR